MKIQDKDYYHGSALTQIVEHPSFKALNKADKKYGHYIINNDIRLFVKYSTKAEGPWQFTFQKDDLECIGADTELDDQVYICLICGLNTICLLTIEQSKAVIDLDCKTSQWIKVKVAPGGSMWVQGQNDSLKNAIPHSAFPLSIFEK